MTTPPVSGLIGERALDPFVQAEPGGRALRDAGGDPRPAQPSQHLQPRPERRGTLAFPAGTPRHQRPGGAFGARPRQMGLAHARLAGEQYHSAGPSRCLGDQRIKDRKLRVSAYQHVRAPHAGTLTRIAAGAQRRARPGSPGLTGPG